MSVQGLDLSTLLGDEARFKPIVNVAPLQAWADHAVAAPGLAAIRATIDLNGLAGEISVFAGSSQLLKRVDGVTRRRPWNRDPKSLDRRERAVTDAEGRWRGTMMVEFAGRDGAQVDGILADIYTDSLLATLVATLAVDEIQHYRSRCLEVREALLESTRAFDLAFEESVIGVALVPLTGHDAGRLARVNDRLSHLSGQRREELLTRNFVELLEPEDRWPQESAFRRALCGRRSPFRSEGRFRRADGSMAWVRITAAPLMDELGEPVQLLVQVEELRDQGWQEEERVERLDELTGLLNPTAFTDQITPIRDRARRTDGTAAMYVAQIDGWDDIVATYGSDVARQLQQQVAQRLRSVLRVDDVIGRLSENEFGFVAEEISTSDAQNLAVRIGEALSKSHRIAGHDVAIEVALGAAMVDRRELQPEELVQRARWAAARAIGHSRGELLYASYQIDAGELSPDGGSTLLDGAQVFRHRRR